MLALRPRSQRRLAVMAVTKKESEIASLSLPTPYMALMSLLSVAPSSATAKSNSMILLPDACRVNIQPARKACSISAESLLNFAGLAAQLTTTDSENIVTNLWMRSIIYLH